MISCIQGKVLLWMHEEYFIYDMLISAMDNKAVIWLYSILHHVIFCVCCFQGVPLTAKWRNGKSGVLAARPVASACACAFAKSHVNLRALERRARRWRNKNSAGACAVAAGNTSSSAVDPSAQVVGPSGRPHQPSVMGVTEGVLGTVTHRGRRACANRVFPAKTL